MAGDRSQEPGVRMTAEAGTAANKMSALPATVAM